MASMGDQREEIWTKEEVQQPKKRKPKPKPKSLNGVCQDDEGMSGVVGTEKKVQEPQPGVSLMEVRLLVPEDGNFPCLVVPFSR